MNYDASKKPNCKPRVGNKPYTCTQCKCYDEIPGCAQCHCNGFASDDWYWKWGNNGSIDCNAFCNRYRTTDFGSVDNQIWAADHKTHASAGACKCWGQDPSSVL